MDYSNIIIMLARQRSGTNALRSHLESHPDIHCHNEVFSLKDINSQDDPIISETNYFNFLNRYASGEIARIYPDQHEKIFIDFLEYLRCFSPKRYMIIDVKYNNTHFLTEPYKWNLAPFLFFLIKKLGIRVMNITRKNYLRFVVSTLKAERTGVWSLKGGQKRPTDEKITIETDYLFRQIRNCDAENKMIAGYFATYPGHRSFEYDDIFAPGSGSLVPSFLEEFSKWLGVPNSYPAASEYRKQSTLPLHQTIENYDEVAAALRDTEFAYCLKDEKMYATRPAVPVAGRRPAKSRQSRRPSVHRKRNGVGRGPAVKKKSK